MTRRTLLTGLLKSFAAIPLLGFLKRDDDHFVEANKMVKAEPVTIRVSDIAPEVMVPKGSYSIHRISCHLQGVGHNYESGQAEYTFYRPYVTNKQLYWGFEGPEDCRYPAIIEDGKIITTPENGVWSFTPDPSYEFKEYVEYDCGL